jgi:hypothetical protein
MQLQQIQRRVRMLRPMCEGFSYTPLTLLRHGDRTPSASLLPNA